MMQPAADAQESADEKEFKGYALLGALLLVLSLPVLLGMLRLPTPQNLGLYACLITAFFVAVAWAKLPFDLSGAVLKATFAAGVVGGIAVFLSTGDADLGQWIFAFGWIIAMGALFYMAARRNS